MIGDALGVLRGTDLLGWVGFVVGVLLLLFVVRWWRDRRARDRRGAHFKNVPNLAQTMNFGAHAYDMTPSDTDDERDPEPAATTLHFALDDDDDEWGNVDDDGWADVDRSRPPRPATPQDVHGTVILLSSSDDVERSSPPRS